MLIKDIGRERKRRFPTGRTARCGLILLLICALLGANLAAGETAYAASGKKAAKKAYKAFLSEENELWCEGYYTTDKKTKFAVLDLNKDGVPELLVETGQGYGAGDASAMAVYAYVNGKVKFITSYNNTIGHYFYCNKAGGVEYYQDSNTILYQSFNGKTMVTKAKVIIKYTGKSTYRSGNGKKISRKKFNAVLKNLQKNAKTQSSAKIRMYKNTKKNRNKYL